MASCCFVGLFACLPVCLSVCLSVCLFLLDLGFVVSLCYDILSNDVMRAMLFPAIQASKRTNKQHQHSMLCSHLAVRLTHLFCLFD